MEKLYLAEVTTTAGRNGHARSSDGLLDIDVRLPKELGGGGGATNPEQLFAAGWSACFGSSIAFVASQQNIKTGDVTVKAEVHLIKTEDGFGIAAKLLVFIPDLSVDLVETLVEAAQKVCAYSNATKNNVVAEYMVVTAL